MIQRRRHPDGTDTSIDHGPGPVGQPPRGVGAIGATRIADAARPTNLRGLFLSKPGHTEYVKEWHRRTGR